MHQLSFDKGDIVRTMSSAVAKNGWLKVLDAASDLTLGGAMLVGRDQIRDGGRVCPHMKANTHIHTHMYQYTSTCIRVYIHILTHMYIHTDRQT